jgi:hypothetical protein
LPLKHFPDFLMKELQRSHAKRNEQTFLHAVSLCDAPTLPGRLEWNNRIGPDFMWLNEFFILYLINSLTRAKQQICEIKHLTNYKQSSSPIPPPDKRGGIGDPLGACPGPPNTLALDALATTPGP